MLQQKLGVTVGGSYGALYQNYSQSLTGKEDSVGGKFTLNISTDLLRRGEPDALTFDMAIEDRRPIGTDEPPLWAGFQARDYYCDCCHLGRVRSRHHPGLCSSEPGRRAFSILCSASSSRQTT